ncbi:MAG: hypothetical protein GEU91_18660 [Rhizobiales bacterium]|nr:hypothetical protein [Hyphomicrobiales bacterium]
MTTSRETREEFIAHIAAHIAARLPESADYALLVLDRLRRQIGLVPRLRHWLLRCAPLTSLFVAAGLLGGVAWTAIGYEAPEEIGAIRGRVLMLPDGQYQLYVVERRPADPETLLRLS